MRAMTTVVPTMALLLLAAAASAAIVPGHQHQHHQHHVHAAPKATAPWKIVEDWTVQLAGAAGGMQILPAYTSVPGIYVASTSAGNVLGVNTSSRAVQWKQQYDDIGFVSALHADNTIFVARYSGTTVLDAFTGTEVWSSKNITMSANLGEAYNAIVFGSTIVYRDASQGFVRLCAVNGTSGKQLWCDKRRVFGSPDAAINRTFTAVFYDVNGSSYVANMDADTGAENWFAYAPRVFTGSENWVGLRNGPMLTIVNSMTGLASATYDVSQVAPIASAVFINNQFFFSDGNYWVAALDCNSGTLLWNVTAPSENPDRRVELQHDTPGILVVATLSDAHTNFTRLNMLTGDRMWTVVAMPTGMSLAPLHAWLGTDILYVRNTHDKWSAWGADTGLEIGSGNGDLFLPRSVRQSYDRPHFSFYVTTNGGEMINLRIEHL